MIYIFSVVLLAVIQSDSLISDILSLKSAGILSDYVNDIYMYVDDLHAHLK